MSNNNNNNNKKKVLFRKVDTSSAVKSFKGTINEYSSEIIINVQTFTEPKTNNIESFSRERNYFKLKNLGISSKLF